LRREAVGVEEEKVGLPIVVDPGNDFLWHSNNALRTTARLICHAFSQPIPAVGRHPVGTFKPKAPTIGKSIGEVSQTHPKG
jgi:hypothetical protein